MASSASIKGKSVEPEEEKLIRASRFRGTVQVSMEPQPRMRLFYGKDLTEAEALLFTNSQQNAGALAFAALGLELGGLALMGGEEK